MFTINNYDYDCTKKCRNPEHGKIINCAITKRSIENELLAAFIAKTCRNFSGITDYEVSLFRYIPKNLITKKCLIFRGELLYI